MLSILPKNHKTFRDFGCPRALRIPQSGKSIAKNRKSQASIELLVFFSIAILIFSITYTVMLDRVQGIYDSKGRSEAAEIGDKLASELNTAISEGQGYSKNITLPQDIFGTGYNISIERGYVFIRWREKNVVARTIADNVTGNFTARNNFIINKEGVIFVNQPI